MPLTRPAPTKRQTPSPDAVALRAENDRLRATVRDLRARLRAADREGDRLAARLAERDGLYLKALDVTALLVEENEGLRAELYRRMFPG